MHSQTDLFKDVRLVEFMSLVFIHLPGESYRSQLRSLLLYLGYIFRALINSLVGQFISHYSLTHLGAIAVQIW